MTATEVPDRRPDGAATRAPPPSSRAPTIASARPSPPAASTSPSTRSGRRGLDAAPVRRRRRPGPRRRDQPRPDGCTGPATTGTSTSRGSRPGSSTATAPTGPGHPHDGLRFDASQGPARPVRPGGRDARRLPPRRGRRRRATPSTADEERGGRPGRVRLGGRPTARPPVARDDHLRGPRRAASPPTRAPASPAGAARARTPGSSRRSRTSSTSGVTAVELLPVFQFDRARGARRARRTTGATSRCRSSRPHRGYASRPRPAGRRRRVPRPRQGAPPRRPRGHPRRRLQPHGGGRRRRPDVLLPRAWPTTTTTCSTPTGRATSTTAGPATRSTPTARSSAGSSSTACATGSRRCTSTGSGSTWRRSCRATRHGQPMADPPTLWDIETDPVLAGTKLIAEAWDAGGLYEVGTFVGDRWVEWNGRFRDDVRSFVKGDPGHGPGRRPALPRQPRHLRRTSVREPQQSVNFVTCHDGFTLNDLVSYDAKHNEANGEGEPRRQRPEPELELRRRGPDRRPGDRAAAAPPGQELPGASTCSRSASPMLLMGDEVRRTPAGQQQRLLPGRRAQLVRLDRRRAARRTSSGSRRALIAGRRRGQALLDVPVDAGAARAPARRSRRLAAASGSGQPDTGRTRAASR